MSLAERILQPNDVPEICDGIKLSIEHKLQIWSLANEDPTRSTKTILEIAKTRNLLIGLDISIRHINRIRKKWNLSGPEGRPWPKKEKQDVPQATSRSPGPIKMIATLSYVGVHLFDIWLENQVFF